MHFSLDTLSPLYVILVYTIAWITAHFMLRLVRVKERSERFSQIDGLRGLLALGVFIHHGSIWHHYAYTTIWSRPSSNLINQLGEAGVSFFFMISSFLFVGKLLQFKGERFDWKRFFVRRFFRLAPLHFFAVLVVIFIVFLQSDWQLNTSVYEFFSSISKWLGFGSIGFAEINGMDASYINSGVLWSLSYEWLLYLSLPILALFLNRTKPSLFFIAFGLLFVAFTLLYRSYEIQHLLSFLGGAVAAVVLKFGGQNFDADKPWISILIILLFVGMFQFHSSENMLSKVISILIFTGIALGNSFFGLLNSKPLHFLSEISYSTYLLHGILLYCTMHIGLGPSYIQQIGPSAYVLILLALTPILILISYITYRWIERPMMEIDKKKG